ncbi:MAG TPA: hypothetical protein VHK69_11380 [Chitinophagaceae bacterium]|nr:hypothetical protein [Chitinophagaceae bacterium]
MNSNTARPDSKAPVRRRRVFLVDGAGAVLSAFFLGIVFVHLERFFGVPRPVSYLLASIACLFALYSFGCYFFAARRWRLMLRIIVAANGLYGCLTIAYVLTLYHRLTVLGLAYFISELLVLAGLILYEVRILSGSRAAPGP